MTVTSLDPAGPVAETIAKLWWLMLGLGVAVFVLFAVLLAIALVRKRSTEPETEGENRAEESSTFTRRWVLVGGVIMPTAVLTVVFGATVYAMRAMPGAKSRATLKVDVIGHQWWFEVRYPDEGVVVRNELHLPVGGLVELRLTSTDVIHSFWVPALGGKMDMLPDKANVLWLQAAEPGEYHSQCAEFCGLHHADMRIRVVAEPPDQLAAWLAAQR